MTFSPDYISARIRFREAAERFGWNLLAYPIGAPGPRGEELTIDVAISSDPGKETDRTLVVSGGLHGVEGFFGSAVQLALLNRWGPAPALGVRCVLLHALNPYGFAWLRRADADNIDPNRNFLLPGEEYSGAAPGYARANALLNPERPPSWDLFILRSIWAIARYGRASLKESLVTGQFDFPRGLFYGGKGPCRTREIVERNFRAWIGDAQTVAHVDLHTGLGRWASCNLLIDYEPTPAQRDRLDRWFGPGTYEGNDPNGTAYRARGSFGRWCVARNFAPVYVFVLAEFGTYGGVSMIAGLRAENQAHHWADPGSIAARRAKERLRELFCPASASWRSRVVAKAVDVAEQALRGLLADRHRQSAP